MSCMRITALQASVLSRQLSLRLSDLPLSGAIRQLSHGIPPKGTPPRTTGFVTLLSLALGGVAVGVGFQQMFLTTSPTPPLQQKPIASEQDAAAAQEAIINAALASTEGSKDKSSSKDRLPWVIDEEMEAIIRRRLIIKVRLQTYLETMHKTIVQLQSQSKMLGPKAGPQWLAERLRELEPEVDLQAQIILFGVRKPNARRDFLMQYGCTRWSDESLAEIARHSPLIEIGAGSGQWQKAIKERGADILAFDNQSALPMEGLGNIGDVAVGDEKEVPKYRKRCLLLVYPGPNDMALNALKLYKGDRLLYVGESRGGINANEAFFDALEKGWEVEKVVNVLPFPDGFEVLWVLRRKGRGRGWFG